MRIHVHPKQDMQENAENVEMKTIIVRKLTDRQMFINQSMRLRPGFEL